MRMTTVAARHAREVSQGKRFRFGKNWARFLSKLTDERIKIAENSLLENLQLDTLEGLSFADIGCGSGLFSLAARRLGAKVFSCDYDPESVSCAAELKRRYFPGDDDWSIQIGSVLERPFIGSLGTFDVVYSWGVLHHTGDMYRALENVKVLAKPRGRLFISIYNDCGEVSVMWNRRKRIYCALPAGLRLLYALSIIIPEELRTYKHFRNNGGIRGYIRYWRGYQNTRGMNRWHDWIDWIGGYPYEYASVEELAIFFEKDDFALVKLEDRSGGIGCHELVFVLNDGNTPVTSLKFGHHVARRSGIRVAEPLERDGGRWIAKIPDDADWANAADARAYVLFDSNKISGVLDPPGRRDGDLIFNLDLPGDIDPNDSEHDWRIARCFLEEITGEFIHADNKQWYIPLPHLAAFADNAEAHLNNSSLCVFEGAVQLPFCHAQHVEIVEFGAGRYSHWGERLLMATMHNDDPNKNGRIYSITYGDTDEAHKAAT